MTVRPNDDTRSASLRGVADLMSASPDPFVMNAGLMVDWIAVQHEPPVTCHECHDDARNKLTPCLSYEGALSVAFAWLLRVIEERDR